MTARWIEQKREYRRYRARIDALPDNYRVVVEALEHYLNHLGGMDDADSILTMLTDLADLFEQAAAEGTPVRGIVGDDPVEFVESFVSNYPAGKWIVRERDRLTSAVDQATAIEAAAGDVA